MRKILGERWKDLDIDHGGFVVHTALNLKADSMAAAAVKRGLREVDKRRGWRGPKEHFSESAAEQFVKRYGIWTQDKLKVGEVYPALVTEVLPSKKILSDDKVKNYNDLPDITLQQIRHFFEHYKDLERASG